MGWKGSSSHANLHLRSPKFATNHPPRRQCPLAHLPRRCSSSVVEHSLGKGEVESSILSGSTIFNIKINYLVFYPRLQKTVLQGYYIV